MLAKSSRLLGVLELAAEKAGWGKPLPAGHARGIAVVNNIGSFNAQVAEVSVQNGKLRVHRVVCAVDCGHVINPAGVEQQIQSGIVYGLSAALKGAITIDRGRVVQGNFNHYDVLRIDEMPVVEVHIVPSQAAPGGIGEASTPDHHSGRRQRHLRRHRQAPAQAADSPRGFGIDHACPHQVNVRDSQDAMIGTWPSRRSK